MYAPAARVRTGIGLDRIRPREIASPTPDDEHVARALQARSSRPDQVRAPNEKSKGTNGRRAASQRPKEVRPRTPVNQLNDLTAKEWIPETVSVWVQRGLGKGHAHAQIERQHPAPFSYQDVARLIRFFTKAGEMVLDPFVGVGSTLKAAALEGRKGIGIELNKKYAELARLRLETELEVAAPQTQEVICGDARKVIPRLSPESVRLVVTSPPYWNILHKKDHKARQERQAHGLDTQYSTELADLGNIESYPRFLGELADVLALTRICLSDGGHLCVVVGDFRHKSQYYMFHADLARELEARGFTLKGLKILYQRHKRVFPYGFPYSYVPNLHHQYVIILAK